MTISDPTLEILELGDLKVDSYTQRSYEERWAKKIADEWNEEKLGVFRISRRTRGGLYVIDGQHRRSAMLIRKMAKNTELFALVHEGLTLKEEAELYVAYNVETRKPNIIDTYRLQLVAEDEETCLIQAVLDKHGLRVDFGSTGNIISAVGALRQIYHLGGPSLLHKTLSLVETAWGAAERDARDGSLLKGVAHVLHKCNGEVNHQSLADKLGKSGRPGQLLGTARTLKSATKRSLWLETAHAVVTVYNKGRTSRKIAL